MKLPLYVILFVIWPQVIKMMSDSENVSIDDEFFANTLDKPRKVIKQNKKQECLKGVISKGKLLTLNHEVPLTIQIGCDLLTRDHRYLAVSHYY